MRKLISFLVLLVSSVARAEVVTCEDVHFGKYLLALSQDSGLIYQLKDGSYQLLEGKVEVRRPSGQPTANVTLKALEPDTGWEAGQCFKWLPPTHRFVLKLSSPLEGSFQLLPHIVVRPGSGNCPVPSPMPGPERKVECKFVD